MTERSPYVAGHLEVGITVLAVSFLLGLTGLGLFLFGGTKDGAAVYTWRESGLVLAAVALAAFVWALNMALPSRRALRVASYGALVVCAVAIVLFIVDYPRNFNIPDSADPTRNDHLARDVSLYAIGLAVMLGAAAASIVAHYVRFAPAVPEPEAPYRLYDIPDWVVEKDIEEATRRHAVSWGLGEAGPREAIVLPSLSKKAKVQGDLGGRRLVMDGKRTEASSQALLATRPALASRHAAPATWADEPTAALRNLREARRADPKAFAARVGFWSRMFRRRAPGLDGLSHSFWHRLRNRMHRPPPPPEETADLVPEKTAPTKPSSKKAHAKRKEP